MDMNQQVISYEELELYEDHVTEAEIARENGCHIDDDGDWQPMDEDYYDW